jgi:long-subunit acyl-CoA synthetase (AMP-forming)
MYTSGSTGVPKGVVLTHKNMMSTLKAYADAVYIYSDDVFLGYLPLAHVFELLAGKACDMTRTFQGYERNIFVRFCSCPSINRLYKNDSWALLHCFLMDNEQ